MKVYVFIKVETMQWEAHQQKQKSRELQGPVHAQKQQII